MWRGERPLCNFIDESPTAATTRGGGVFEIKDDSFHPFYLLNFPSARWDYWSCGRICSAFLVLHGSACKSPG